MACVIWSLNKSRHAGACVILRRRAIATSPVHNHGLDPRNPPSPRARLGGFAFTDAFVVRRTANLPRGSEHQRRFLALGPPPSAAVPGVPFHVR